MALEHPRAGHNMPALDAFWTAKNASSLPATLPDAAQRNGPAAVFREIGAIFAATLAFVAAVDLALIAFGVR